MEIKEISEKVMQIILKDTVKRTLKSMLKEDDIAKIAKREGTISIEISLWEVTSEISYEQARKLRVERGQRRKRS